MSFRISWVDAAPMEGAAVSCEGRGSSSIPCTPSVVRACPSQFWGEACPLGRLISPTFSATGPVFFLSESQLPAVVRAKNVVLGGAQ